MFPTPLCYFFINYFQEHNKLFKWLSSNLFKMALTSFLIDIGARLIIAFVFVVVNTLILREVAVLIFKLKDETMATALYVSLGVSIAVLVFSFFPTITLLSIILAVLISIIFIVLVKFYYKTDWKKSVLIWLVWFIAYFILGTLVVLISVLV